MSHCRLGVPKRRQHRECVWVELAHKHGNKKSLEDARVAPLCHRGGTLEQ